MKRIVKIVLLYENRTWIEIECVTAEREIPLDKIYEMVPDEYKTKGLMKIYPLGFKGHYNIIDLRAQQS